MSQPKEDQNMRTLICTNQRGSITRHPIGSEISANEAMRRLGVDNENWTVELETDDGAVEFLRSRSAPLAATTDSRIIARDGTYYLRAQDVREGDLLDLEGDSIVDPENKGERYDPEPPATYTSFQYEFAEVLEVERETATCIVIHTTQGSYGFPPEHELETTLDSKTGELVP